MAIHRPHIYYLIANLFILVVVGMYYFERLKPTRCIEHLRNNTAASVLNIQQSFKDSPTIEEMFSYFHLPNSTACQFAVDFGFHVYVDGEVDAPDGHKAVCLDQGVSPKYGDCLSYSFGINNEWTFDEAMEKFGCKVFSFDPSMGVSSHRRTRRIYFLNIGLSGKDDAPNPSEWTMKSLPRIYKMLQRKHGLRPIDVLKIDIEFAEWDVIPSIIESGLTDKIKQIAIEIHFHPDDSFDIFKSYYRKLRSLEEAGFIRFSSRLNPWLKRYVDVLGREDYVGFELAWYNSKYLPKHNSTPDVIPKY